MRKRRRDDAEDDTSTDVIGRINEILKAYENARRRFFWSDTAESRRHISRPQTMGKCLPLMS